MGVLEAFPPKMGVFPPKILGGNEKIWGGTTFGESRSPPKSETLGGQYFVPPQNPRLWGGSTNFVPPPSVWGVKSIYAQTQGFTKENKENNTLFKM